MQFKSIPWWVWVIPFTLLFFATDRIPYGYTFTRIMVCGFSTYFAVIGWQRGPLRIWSVLFGLLAILFNPILPIPFSDETGSYLDVGGAIIFAAHLVFVRVGVPSY
jgi:hypothetical protein